MYRASILLGATHTSRRISGRFPVGLALVFAAACFVTTSVAGQNSPQGPTSRDIRELAPEDLMRLRVTSASRKEEALSNMGAALFVITREDIASSGANSIPDLTASDKATLGISSRPLSLAAIVR